jgi:ATP-dependent RNA helicase DDX52/ROK1
LLASSLSLWTLTNPSPRDSAVTSIDQSLLYTASESGKTLALLNLLNTGNLPYPSLIFTQSIERAEELYKLLALEGMRVECLHGQKGNKKREEVVDEFRKGEVWCLVVTEVLARGMDFRGVKVVVNYGECLSRIGSERVQRARRERGRGER